MSFPLDALDLHLEALIDGEWENLGTFGDPTGLGPTNRLASDKLTITHGRQNEGSRVSPCEVRLTLWNDDGLLTPTPASDWWRDDGTGWDLNTQIRVRVGSAVPGGIRLHGEISEIVPVWPVGDIADPEEDEGEPGYEPGISFVEVTVSGILRRLGQRRKPLRSCLYRVVTSPTRLPHVYDYFPSEDGRDGQVIASGIPNALRAPMTFSGDVSLAADDDLPGSEPLPMVPEGKSGHWFAAVQGFAAEGVIEGFFRIQERPNDVATIVRIVDVYTTGTLARFNAEIVNVAGIPLININAYDSDGILVEQQTYTLYSSIAFFTSAWMQYRLTLTESGGSTSWNLYWARVTPAGDIGEAGSGTWSGTIDQVYAVGGGVGLSPPKGYSFGQTIVHDGITAGWLVGADVGMFNEAARNRAGRLGGEEGVTIGVVSGIDTRSMPMGAQKPATLPDLLQECADADRGILCEFVRGFGIAFIHRRFRYNQSPKLTLDAAQSQISNPFTPTRDDQLVRNDVTAQRRDGTSVRLTDETSIERFGVYDEQVTLNISDDLVVRHVAGWQLRLGRDVGIRVAQLTIDFGIAPNKIAGWQSVNHMGLEIRVINLPPQMGIDTLDLVVQGYSETLEAHSWVATINCTPADPWKVAKWGVSEWNDPTSILGL